jgi:hypothetical protein
MLFRISPEAHAWHAMPWHLIEFRALPFLPRAQAARDGGLEHDARTMRSHGPHHV